MWGGVVLVCSFTSLGAFLCLDESGPAVQGTLISLAGGGVLAMTLQTVIPEALRRPMTWSACWVEPVCGSLRDVTPRSPLNL